MSFRNSMAGKTSGNSPECNPKGIVSASPGLRAASCPGPSYVWNSTPTGLRHVCVALPQPRWGWRVSSILPKVARCSQPWASSRNPFGIHPQDFSKVLRLAVNTLLFLLAASVSRAGTNDFRQQAIALPGNAWASRFADLNRDGKFDLLAVDAEEKKLFIFRQRTSGFTNAPDQVITLPPLTAWIAPFDVDTNRGRELLMSTATGLVYHRQNGGVFESEPRTLIRADQVFTADDSPRLISLPTNAAIPVISATQAVLYTRSGDLAWQPGAPIALATRRNSWSGNRDNWTMGSNPSRSLHLQQSFQAKPDADEKPENETIKKLLVDLKKSSPQQEPGMSRVDIDGDGRKDLVVWQVFGEMEPRTDVYVFRRGADGQLPARPTQVLHCHGFPVPVGSTVGPSPIADLNGDGTPELVLVEVRMAMTSASSVMEMALSRGVEMALTIRAFNQGAFSRSPDAAIPIKVMMTLEAMEEWSFFICGDFNGDGHPDLVVKRSPTQWNIFTSTGDGHWFTPQPAMTFDAPAPGNFEIKELHDLNGDGRADIVLRARDDPRIFILLSQSPRMKGTQ